jgi:hypothetical protein
MNDTTAVPLVCVPGAIGAEARPEHRARTERLFGKAALKRASMPDGYQFSFEVTELEELARFVALERKCCPFLTFDLAVTGHSDRVTLRMHGPPGSREVIQAEILP